MTDSRKRSRVAAHDKPDKPDADIGAQPGKAAAIDGNEATTTTTKRPFIAMAQPVAQQKPRPAAAPNAASLPPPAADPDALARKEKARRAVETRKARDVALKAVLILSGFLCAFLLLWILGYVTIQGIPSLTLSFLASLAPQFVATLLIVLGSLAVSIPIGICSAIYLHEYAKPGRIVTAIRFSIECLSGIPSILFGLFGMVFFGVALHLGFSLFAATLTLSIMVLPTLIRTTEEALATVPDSYREGSLALGAGKLRTTMRIVLPCALPGIVTASLLAMGRIVGETAAVYLTAGTMARMPSSFLSSGRTLAVHLYLTAKEAVTADAFAQSYATATLLILLVLALHIIVQRIARGNKKA